MSAIWLPITCTSSLSLMDSRLMKKADTIVYYLYGLTYQDILIVDPETTITREEYEGSLKLPFD